MIKASKIMYPRSYQVLGEPETILDLHVYEVNFAFITLGKQFEEWMLGQTMLGLVDEKIYIYAWDVENYLEGGRVWD